MFIEFHQYNDNNTSLNVLILNLVSITFISIALLVYNNSDFDNT